MGKFSSSRGLISLVTGLIFGLAPATQASNFGLSETLKEGGRDSGAGSRGNRIRGVLVISEVAVSFLLLIGAGLLINSFLHLRKLDPFAAPNQAGEYEFRYFTNDSFNKTATSNSVNVNN